MGVRRALAAGLLLVAFGLAGCGDDEPEPGPPATTGAGVTSGTPSENGSAEPKLGPVATVRAWVKAYNELFATGDDGPLDELSDLSCEMCRNLADPVVEVYAAGGSYKAGRVRILGAGVARRDHGAVVVDAGIIIPAGAVKMRKGEAFKEYPSDKFLWEFTVDPTQSTITHLVGLS